MTVAATGSGTMKSRFKSNNFIAILIAIFLIATGFTLGFIHKRSTAEEEKKQARQTSSETAYAGFRKERARQRGLQVGRITLDSKKLADTLTSYSEQGTSYTEELKNTISYNRLERADMLRLMEGDPIYFH